MLKMRAAVLVLLFLRCGDSFPFDENDIGLKMERERFSRYAGNLSFVEASEAFGKGSKVPPSSGLQVYSFWAWGSGNFSPANYGALESALHAMPAAEHYFMVFAGQRAGSYRFADMLSRTQFAKYRTRGYKVVYRLVNANDGWMAPSATVSPPDTSGEAPGRSWWRHATSSKLSTFPALTSFREFARVDTYRVHPRDVLFTVATHLFTTGGLFHDFTFLFHGDAVGDYIHNRDNGVFYWTSGEAGEMRGDGWIQGESHLLFAPREGSDELRCVLELYDQYGVHNTPPFVDASEASLHLCLRVVNEEFVEDAVGWDADLTPEAWTLVEKQGGCAKVILSHCIDDQPPNSKSPTVVSAEELSFESGWQSLNELAVVWLGPQATKGVWETLPSDAPLAQAFHRKRARLFENPSQIFSLLERSAETHCSWAPGVPCDHHKSFLVTNLGLSEEKLLKDKSLGDIFAVSRYKCAPAFVVPGAMKGASTFVWSLVELHPLVLPALCGKGFKETGVYTEKDLIPDAIVGANETSQPRGSLGVGSIKSHEKKMHGLVHTFPVISEKEPFVSGDGTVTYMMSRTVPFQLHLDQPKLKIVFALRDPVERMWSGYRFAFKSWEKEGEAGYFDNIARTGLRFWSTCLQGIVDTKWAGGVFPRSEIKREIISGNANITVSADMLAELLFGRKIDLPSQCPHNMRGKFYVTQSVYVPQVWNWVRIFGKEQIKIITLEELKSGDTAEILNDLYDFLGLCRGSGVVFDSGKANRNSLIIDMSKVDRNPTVARVWGKEHEISKEVFEELHSFFAPFNEMLYELIGRRLPWGAERFSAKYKFDS